MAQYIKTDEFVRIATEQNLDGHSIIAYIRENINPDYNVNITTVNNRIANYQRKGLLPLASGNSIDRSTILKGTSTLFDMNGHIVQQWVKTDALKEGNLTAFTQAVEDIASRVIPTTATPFDEDNLTPEMADLLTVYPLGDPHVGMLAHAAEVGEDNDLYIIENRLTKAMSLSVEQALPTQTAFIVDTGKLIAA